MDYSMDLRERVAAAIDEGEGSERQIAKRFRVSVSFVTRLLQRRRDAGTLAPKPHGGGPRPVLGFPEQVRLAMLIAEHPDATLKQLDVIRNKGYNSRMMTYATLQSDRREFLALTGLTLQEFQLLLNAFTPAYERRYPKDRTLADRPRQRCAGGGRKGVLDCPEQKLLFLLVYLKTYPLQVLMGELFGLSQPGVNYWIHRLLPVLRDALDSLSVLPERNPNDFARSQTATGTEPRLIIDGTERRRQRPKSPEKQALHYSGKKKAHTDKNVVIVDLRRKCIGFLSRTYVGKTHDKKIADSEGISYPPKAELYKDTGFQGYEPAVTRTCQAKKKPPRGELTAAEKRTNRKLARIRVNVEHALAGVKRSRIVKDVLRNTKDGVSDSAMEAACGLHNLRVQNRKRPLRR